MSSLNSSENSNDKSAAPAAISAGGDAVKPKVAMAKGKKQNFTPLKQKKEVYKVHLDKGVTDIQVAGHQSKYLKDAFLWLMMGSDGIAVQFTIHRPIGVTNCPENSWVMSLTADIPGLLAGAEDSSLKVLQQARGVFRTRWLVQHKLLVLEGDVVKYPPEVDPTRQPRGKILDDASKALAAANKEHRLNLKQNVPGKADDWYNRQNCGKSVSSFLTKEIATHEDKILIETKKNHVEVKAELAFPQSYITTYMGRGEEQIAFFVSKDVYKVKDFLYSTMRAIASGEVKDSHAKEKPKLDDETQTLRDEVIKFQKSRNLITDWSAIEVLEADKEISASKDGKT